MTTNINHLKESLCQGQVALGAWMFFREQLVAAAASKMGYDFVCVDMQHGVQGFENVSTMVDAIVSGGATAVVRTPRNEPELVGRLLDAGALAIIIPIVNDRAAAELAVRSCRYPPLGDRSMGAIGATVHYGDDYFDNANSDILVIPMIETVEALDNIDDIVSVDGVDTILVGPNDLGISMGLPPRNDYDTPEFEQAIETIVDRCGHYGVTPGIYCSSGLVEKRINQGFRLLSVSTDWDVVMDGLANDLKKSRAISVKS